MTLIDDYLAEQEKYELRYGENTIVLMQVGHFYECYAVDNQNEQINGTNLYKLSDILNITPGTFEPISLTTLATPLGLLLSPFQQKHNL